MQKYRFDTLFSLKKVKKVKKQQKGTFKTLPTGHCLETFKYLKVSKRVLGAFFTIFGNFDLKNVSKKKEEQDIPSRKLQTEHRFETFKYLKVSRRVPSSLPPSFWYIW